MGIVGGVKGVVMTLEGVDSVLYQKEIVGAVLRLKGVMGVVLHQKEMIQPPVALHSHALSLNYTPFAILLMTHSISLLLLH